MCKHGTTKLVDIDGEKIAVDKCIAPLIEVLNENGYKTIASCCGHGKQPTSIVLEGEGEIRIFDEYEDARLVDKLFPPINSRPNEWKHALKRKVIRFIVRL